MAEKTKIAIRKIKNDDVKTAVFSALELIEAQKLMKKKDMVILLKPNLLAPKPPERAVDTHPEVLRSVIQWVKKFNHSNCGADSFHDNPQDSANL